MLIDLAIVLQNSKRFAGGPHGSGEVSHNATNIAIGEAIVDKRDNMSACARGTQRIVKRTYRGRGANAKHSWWSDGC